MIGADRWKKLEKEKKSNDVQFEDNNSPIPPENEGHTWDAPPAWKPPVPAKTSDNNTPISPPVKDKKTPKKDKKDRDRDKKKKKKDKGREKESPPQPPEPARRAPTTRKTTSSMFGMYL